jgi:uncharacterized protein (TIGR00304 family)
VARWSPLLVAALALIAAGIALLALAAVQGDVRLFLVVVVPVITGEGATFALGALALMAGVLLAFIAIPLASTGDAVPAEAPPAQMPPSAGTAPEGPSSWGGVVFVGPIPIVLGSDAGMRRYMLVAAVVMAILVAVFVAGALFR